MSFGRPIKQTGRGQIYQNKPPLTEQPGSRNLSRKSPSAYAGSDIGEDDTGNIKMKLQNVSAEKEKLKKELDQAKKEVFELQTKATESKKDKDNFQKATKELTDLRARFDKDSKKDKDDLQKANKDLKELRARIEKLSEDKKKLEKDMTLLQTNTKLERDSELKEKTKELTTCKSKLNTADAEKNKLEKQLDDVLSRLNTAEAESKKRVTELSELQSKLTSAETESKQREKQLNDLSTESSKRIKELTSANDELMKRFDKDTKKDKQELQKANKELTELQAKLNTADVEKNILEKQLNDVQSRLNTAEAESKKRVTEFSELQSKLNTAEAESKQRKKQLNDFTTESSKRIYELTAANDELMTRLSKHLGAKLQDNNPNIADLSDPNRPTKLAEQFSGLYDDDWTNSYEFMKQHKQEVDVVDILLKACVKIYNQCIDKASMELKDLQRVFLVFNSDSDVNSKKQLKDRRKKLEPDKQLQSIIASDMKDLFGEKIVTHKKIIPYVQKCLDICWSMAIQDPPVHMDTDLNKNRHPFDTAAYRPYTQSGTSVDFIVWPALYLHKDGSLLQKGIAQGMTSEDSVGGRRASPVNKKNRVKAS